MDDEEIITYIERLQGELRAMKAFQRDYLDRRARRGHRTDVDATMEGHQQLIEEVLDLLEAVKAEKQQGDNQ